MMHKLLIIVLLAALIGLVVWDISTHASTPQMINDGPNFRSAGCPSCDRMFYVEKTQREGWCPYDGIQIDFSSAE
jgi:hypothetical protein